MKSLPKILILCLLATLIGAPPLVAGYFNLSEAQRAQINSDDQQASIYYESAAKFLFWRADLYELAGLSAHNDPARAIHLLETARQNGTLTPHGQVALGDAYLANGQTDQALGAWEKLLAQNQEILNISPRLAPLYHKRLQFTSEADLLKLWLAADPNNPAASESLGRLLAARAAPEAVALLNSATAASPQAAARLAGLITALAAPDTDPAFQLVRCGQALAGLDEWQLAGQSFESAVKANPTYAQAWAWLGLARQHNNSPEAQQAIEYALKLDPQSAALHAMLGTYWQQAGKPQDARRQFAAATQLEPDNPAWWLALAGAAAQIDLSEALNAYIQAVNLAPQESGYWYALAAFSVEHNSYIEDYGLSAALRAFALEPKNPVYMDMLGRAQMAVDQSAAAEVMFKKALSESASDGPFYIYHFHLGLLYLQTGRNAQAKSEFEQTLEFDPHGPYGAQAKKLIERYFP
jgi:tetratricopeptide (TPR) repeat protein